MIDNKRPFVTARTAAERLGVTEETVVDDIQEGMDGALPALLGGRYGDAWVVYQFEVEGVRLDMHRARLAGVKTGVTE